MLIFLTFGTYINLFLYSIRYKGIFKEKRIDLFGLICPLHNL